MRLHTKVYFAEHFNIHPHSRPVCWSEDDYVSTYESNEAFWQVLEDHFFDLSMTIGFGSSSEIGGLFK